MIGDLLFERSVARQQFDRIVLRAAKPQPLAIRFGFLPRLDLTGEIARKGAACGADVVSDGQRRFIVARNQSPKDSIYDDGNRSRRSYPHVLEVLQMDWRDAAKNAVTHI